MLAASLALGLWGSAARGADGRPAHGDWLGAWAGLEVRGGVGLGGYDASRPSVPLAGLSARLATLLSLVDLDLGLGVRGAVSEGAAEGLVVSPALEARLHPFFMRHLRGAWATAALYASLGVGVDLVTPRGAGSEVAAGLALRVGFGGDVPLSDPRDGSPSVWLGLGYRLRVSGVPGAAAGLRDQDGHELWAALSWRWHGLDFARVPRPPELDDRDP